MELGNIFGFVGNSYLGQKVVHSIPGIIVGAVARDLRVRSFNLVHGMIFVDLLDKTRSSLNDEKTIEAVVSSAEYRTAQVIRDPRNHILNNSPIWKRKLDEDGGSYMEPIGVDEALFNKLEYNAKTINGTVDLGKDLGVSLIYTGFFLAKEGYKIIKKL